MKIRLTNGSGLIKEADWGFSWKTFFFGVFVPLVRGDVAWFFIGLCLSIFTAGIGLLIFPFVYNKIYVKKQLEQGFYPLDELSRVTLVNANLILDKGPLSQGTQQVPTSTPPAVQVSPKETPVVEVPRPVLPTSTPSPQAAEAPPPSPTGWACVSCRAENAPGNRFCFACGREREKPKPVCSNCGEQMDGKMKFCPSCGSALSGHGDNKGIDTRPTEVSPPVVQPYQATAPNPAPIPTVSQQTTSKPASFPAVAVAAIVLALGVLILVLSKGDVLFSFFKGSEKVTASEKVVEERPSGAESASAFTILTQEKSLVGKSIKPLISSTQAGDANSKFRIALYSSEKGVSTEDLTPGIKRILDDARSGNPEAMGLLGYLCENGRCVERKSAEAARWYEKAAHAGLTESMNDIGYMYLNGVGVGGNDVAAANWFRKGAELGNLEAMNNLGYMYTKGRGVQKDHAQAAFWYEKAANQGQPHAMKNLGHAYMYGLGLPQDQQLGKKWLLQAAEAGEPNAMYSIARMYEHGVGCVQDYGEAVHWYKKASLSGHDGALRGLANLYKKGRGVGQDFSEAEKLLEMAERIKREF